MRPPIATAVSDIALLSLYIEIGCHVESCTVVVDVDYCIFFLIGRYFGKAVFGRTSVGHLLDRSGFMKLGH